MPEAHLLEYAPPAVANPIPLWLRSLAAGISALAIAIVFAPFASGVSPWDVVAAPFTSTNSDWALTLLGTPFFLAFPLFWLSVRLLLSSRMFRIELAIIWFAVAILITAAPAVDAWIICDMLLNRSSDGASLVSLAIPILFAGGLILFFNRRSIGRESLPAMAAYIAYLSNGLLCLVNFRDRPDIGLPLTILAGSLMLVEFAALLIWSRRLRFNASASPAQTPPK